MTMPWLPVIILVLGVFVGYSLIDRFDPSKKTLPVADPEFLRHFPKNWVCSFR